ncbi:WYL domain-containing protein [uncultured Robinsoniella sp.]|uniref:WYL domain-containing protein n=1 Tax=uncultured Robinsoniella sp. TaxID=904190 RepID=UPI00374FB63A
MAYTELIKNFERIRDYMREFYVYGFKSREEFEKKSSRSYDNERRRIESYLGDYMEFRMAHGGKNVFLSIDSRTCVHNPLYKAFKAKSFTSGDITLHFILFDILYKPEITYTLKEITDIIDTTYLSIFRSPMLFDESTVRKKLKEYIELGLVKGVKQGRQIAYSRTGTANLSSWYDAINYFSEAGLCGVIGSFLLDQTGFESKACSFKHHYITHALESEVLCQLLHGISQKRSITITNVTNKSDHINSWDLVPLQIFVSVQNGRRYLMGYSLKYRRINSYRLDYITGVKIGEISEDFNQLREKLAAMQKYMWGISCNRRSTLEHVEFTISIDTGEEHILQRLEREKRCGTVQRIDQNTCRFIAEVYDTSEMIPWIRTFICRITSLNFSNRTIENQFKQDILDMYALYQIESV